MSYEKLAKKIRDGYNELTRNTAYKSYNVTWNDRLETAEISVENDAGFKAIIIGNTRNVPESRGCMYLFYTDDVNVPFPTVKEIMRRIRTVADREALADKDSGYFDWKEFGTLEKQRAYFSEIITKASLNT